MVKYSGRLDGTFGALSDPTRRAILARLALGELTVSQLAKPFACSLPAISKHLRVLEGAGLIRRRRRGRERIVRLQAKPMQEAARWIEFYRRFWEERLAALKDYLESAPPESTD